MTPQWLQPVAWDEFSAFVMHAKGSCRNFIPACAVRSGKRDAAIASNTHAFLADMCHASRRSHTVLN
jgi:hypothetical protein